MAYILAVVNQKGGVGKTTTTVNLASFLAARGKRVLLIDMDPQGNATSGLGIPKTTELPSTYDLLLTDLAFGEIVHRTDRRHLHLCPSNIDLAGAEVELVQTPNREFCLQQALKPIRSQYDWILLDCPPSLGFLTLNAMVAADGLLLPVQAEYYALEGLTQLIDTLERVREHFNSDLSIFGLLLTMYDSRTTLAQQVEEEVRNHFGDAVFQTVIPRNVRLSEAPSYGLSIREYDSKSKGALAYHELAKEVLRRARNLQQKTHEQSVAVTEQERNNEANVSAPSATTPEVEEQA